MKLLLVEWVDSHSTSKWRGLDDLEEISSPYPAKTVGWLVKETNKVVMLASTLGAYDQKDYRTDAADIMTIPKVSIIKRRTIKEKR